MTASMPALCRSWPRSRPAGPAPMMATWTRIARSLRGLVLFQLAQEAVELVGEALAVGVVERRRAAGALARAAQLVQVVAQGEALGDVLDGVELAARVEGVATLGDDVRGERDVGGDDEVAGFELAHDVAVGDVDAA